MDGQAKIKKLQDNIEQVIKGKSDVIKLAIVTLLGRGHLLIEDVPGVGKTTLAHCLARSLDSSFRRIQFTSDLLPSDIIGISVYSQQQREFEFKPGPLFCNIILADEINRTTPKTQSSLLEAMNDAQVSVDSKTHPLPQPFMVVATQNPMEYQGTYPLPESQLDRFMMRIRIGYPSGADEKKILQTQQSFQPAEGLKPVLTGPEVVKLQDQVTHVRVEESLVDYLLAIVTTTRQSDRLGLGASPRAAMSLHKAAQALAFIEGRDYCFPDDFKYLAPFVLSHRVIINSRVDAHGYRSQDAEQVITELVDQIPVPL